MHVNLKSSLIGYNTILKVFIDKDNHTESQIEVCSSSLLFPQGIGAQQATTVSKGLGKTHLILS
jgi:hypothetical protein